MGHFVSCVFFFIGNFFLDSPFEGWDQSYAQIGV